MKFRGIGLAAALVVAMTAPAATVMAAKKPEAAAGGVDAKAREKGMKEVPALLTAGGYSCQLADARWIGSDKTSQYYEIACSAGMPGVIVAAKDQAPKLHNCVDTSAPTAEGKPNGLACKLPGNANPAASLQPLVAKTGAACTVEKARFIGSSPTASFYEVACQGGAGYILQADLPVDPAKGAMATTCLQFDAGDKLACELTTRESQLAVVDTLAASSGKNCSVKDRRYILTTKDGARYFEAACTDNKGYVFEQKADGSLGRTIACIDAGFVGGGCTMSDTAAAKTEQNALYASLAAKAGYKCALEKYGVFNAPAGKEIIELKCTDRPDGAIAIFDAKGGNVFNCAVAEAQGYRCNYSTKETGYAAVTGDLKKLGKSDCTVSGARGMEKKTDTANYLEVACSDGLPGWVIGYAAGTSKPTEVLSCLQAQGLGGCKLPTNVKKS